MSVNEDKINTLFEELVPASGPANTVAGEIIRAVNRIVYRNFNDGDHIGVGYGNETCNPAARYLMATVWDDDDDSVIKVIEDMWGEMDDNSYNEYVEQLEGTVLAYLEKHPELKETENLEDMWSYRDTDEDIDQSDTDWDWDYDDEYDDDNENDDNEDDGNFDKEEEY